MRVSARSHGADDGSHSHSHSSNKKKTAGESSIESPAEVPTVGNGSSSGNNSSSNSGMNPLAQPYQPQNVGSGNSYHAPPTRTAAERGDRAPPQAQLGSTAPQTARMPVLDARHGTLAPRTKRERRKLGRACRLMAEAASGGVVAREEAVGDGVTSSQKSEEEEEEEEEEASEAVESQGLVKSFLIRDEQAAARSKAIIVDESIKLGSGFFRRQDVEFGCPDELESVTEIVQEAQQTDAVTRRSRALSCPESETSWPVVHQEELAIQVASQLVRISWFGGVKLELSCLGRFKG